MSRILVGVTGSVAAIKTPDLYALLVNCGHQPRIVATARSLHFFDSGFLHPRKRETSDQEMFFTDNDEWIGSGVKNKYQRGDPVLHIELRRWADILLIAPLDANILAKFALGLTDGCLCSLWRAWCWDKPVVLAPAMNSIMWNHPATHRHVLGIAQDSGLFSQPFSENGNVSDLINEINGRGSLLKIVPPANKILACGDEGIGAMAELEDIIFVVNQLVSVR
jgi:phosphopantothenoylcysteine decarboxylase